jgi:hypothetical protein
MNVFIVVGWETSEIEIGNGTRPSHFIVSIIAGNVKFILWIFLFFLSPFIQISRGLQQSFRIQVFFSVKLAGWLSATALFPDRPSVYLGNTADRDPLLFIRQ